MPDDLPHEYILGIARPYLGESLSMPSDWTPLKNYLNNFHGYNQPEHRFGRSVAVQEFPGYGRRLT